MADWLLKEWEERGKEIAALRAELEQARENTKTLLANHQNVRAQLEQARAERDKLREALSGIEKFGHGDGYGRGYTCANMARAALKDSKEN